MLESRILKLKRERGVESEIFLSKKKMILEITDIEILGLRRMILKMKRVEYWI